jgi:hypothetical protein
MREAINNNPMVQIGLIGVLVVVVGFMLMTRMKGDDKPATPPPGMPAGATGPIDPTTGAPAAPGTSGTADPAASATLGTTSPSGTSTAAAAPTSTGTAPATTGTVDPTALIPGPGLPAPVVQAWARGDAIVLLIVKKSAVDDKLVRSSVNSLSGDRAVSVFVAPAEKVARYSRITQGVGVNRVPALVVVRPRRLSGDTPEAQVSYGFRNSQSVQQAVNDALYGGREDVPYHPG